MPRRYQLEALEHATLPPLVATWPTDEHGLCLFPKFSLSSLLYSDEEDALVWQFTSNGIYSSQSLYRIINFRGIKPILVPSIWNLKLPPRVHYFLWLVCKNKILTRDNLGKRKKIEDDTCLFCNEKETINHLFFECVVAKQMWTILSSIFYV